MKTLMKHVAITLLAVSATMMADAADAPTANVTEILLKHDRALVRELAVYLRQNPKAEDLEQAHAALFNKAIERDWFAETEDLARGYLKAEPEGPVKALAQIIITMSRAQSGQFEEALANYRTLVQSLNPAEQAEFALSFSDSLSLMAIGEGQIAVAREIAKVLLTQFGDDPEVRRKVQGDLKRLDKVGKPAPDFAVEDVKGQTIKLDTFRGKYVLLDFWATWCSPCIAELPRLQLNYKQYGGKDLEIIGVSLDDNKTAVIDFVKVHNIAWPQVHNATCSADLVDSFGVSSIPATFLIDPEGKVVRLDLRGKKLEQALGQLIKRPVSRVTGRS